MNMEFIRKLPIPKELKAQFSLSEKLISVKESVTQRSRRYSPANQTKSC